ncbi:unnamed protein product [Cochlearia groenlandica]
MVISSSNVERPSWSPVIKRSESTVAFLDLHFIECTICLDTLTSHIFHFTMKCDNGHLVCSPCLEMLSQKCATWSLPIVSRNLSMERLIEKLKYPCSNAQFGCPDGVTDGERSKHIEEYCDFVQRPCSFPSCDFTGSYNDLKQHMDAKHTICKVKVENAQLINQGHIGCHISIVYVTKRFTNKQTEKERDDLWIAMRKSEAKPSIMRLMRTSK